MKSIISLLLLFLSFSVHAHLNKSIYVKVDTTSSEEMAYIKKWREFVKSEETYLPMEAFYMFDYRFSKRKYGVNEEISFLIPIHFKEDYPDLNYSPSFYDPVVNFTYNYDTDTVNWWMKVTMSRLVNTESDRLKMLFFNKAKVDLSFKLSVKKIDHFTLSNDDYIKAWDTERKKGAIMSEHQQLPYAITGQNTDTYFVSFIYKSKYKLKKNLTNVKFYKRSVSLSNLFLPTNDKEEQYIVSFKVPKKQIADFQMMYLPDRKVKLDFY